ncbi:sigma factor [Acuticoccus mangrovi]|uniref:RNA polymerase sigma-70 region 2 domain-containing protein n=1 Tax=Acuticoccus mangrovi TaxID=2796142 RepID=A0A934ILS4_9HYPH|nr:sigma factor [Acuticoccus mangrovi]MBJ3778833.1 hypothetical protein [Acuticoccus mangrovi]
MDRPLSPDDIHTLIREADATARRLHRKLRLPAADLDDLRQDLLTDLIARMPGFDPERGSLGAFAGLVMRNRSVRIAETVARQRRLTAGGPMSVDAPAADANRTSLADQLSEADGLGAWHGQRVDHFEQIDGRFDVDRAIAGIAMRDRPLCAALADRSVDRLANAGFGARTSLYRRVRELRMVLAAEGLLPRWDAFRAA